MLTSTAVRRLIASAPRGRGRVSRFISRRYPRSQVFQLVGPLANSLMHLNTADPFQAEMAYGAYQSNLIEKMLGLARPGDVVLTAGAQLGYVALTLAKAVGESGKVLAFEADPHMLKECRRNLALNRAGATVTLIPVGLSSNNAELEMAISSTAGQSSLSLAHHQVEATQVPVRVGDEVLAELGVEKLDGVLLDVEGWEMHVLRGLSNTLSSYLPRWAIIECWDEALRGADSSAEQLLLELRRLGWEISSVDGGPARDGHDIVCISTVNN